MPRIYQSEQMGRGYQGSAQSAGFNPEIAVSDERSVREYGAARVQDAETVGREISRQMQLEANQLQLQQGIDRASQGVAPAQIGAHGWQKQAIGKTGNPQRNSSPQRQSQREAPALKRDPCRNG